MSRIHYAVKKSEILITPTGEDCLCKKVPFPKLTKDWNNVTYKYCLKLKDKFENSETDEVEE